MSEKEIKVVGGTAATVKIAESAVAKLPWLVNPILQSMATILSPFDRHLRLNILLWEDKLCELEVPKLRRLRDHQGRIHPSVINASGERAAFFLLQRNFPFWQYLVELKEIDCVFARKLEGVGRVRCAIDVEDLNIIKAQLASKHEANIKLRSEILSLSDTDPRALVRTSWVITKRNLLRDLWKS